MVRGEFLTMFRGKPSSLGGDSAWYVVMHLAGIRQQNRAHTVLERLVLMSRKVATSTV